mgnify:CR=1 FL=1
MFEQWQPLWDVVLLLTASGIIVTWLYIKGDNDLDDGKQQNSGALDFTGYAVCVTVYNLRGYEPTT